MRRCMLVFAARPHGAYPFRGGKKEGTMQVSEIMTTRIVSVEPTATVREAATLMSRNNIGSVPVVDGGAVRGMLTDRDIVLRCVSENKDADTVKVSDICTHGAVSVRPQDPVSNAMHLMSAEQVRRLPVVDNGKLVGMLSFADVAREKTGMEVAQSISEISMP
ncbi:putative signal transduction protein with CBS domains [Ethanoligenens harbinense YUAN-3]|uniref:Putative signal transduction protein with CBS domains n=2 Tax=Ethanoligenens harbinense TaxID=253239 RepID=E6U2J2_ETHHY|nr:putative signal transduction protein with CBS domains [Ethanoligenens harbinense YUAN-3]AVQ95417.1 CBS domain-containing protein [Ethanoligenens harbinense YUAN-3]AYF38082.1 CBS domain-containing protein [Ethanoligenens harbinense]AYF40827.1 CBS domain-containing protein [Ethanoligenens harbinense]QCN91658.1 CBS domain-containing protein [Ethanoligenens harbinense]